MRNLPVGEWRWCIVSDRPIFLVFKAITIWPQNMDLQPKMKLFQALTDL